MKEATSRRQANVAGRINVAATRRALSDRDAADHFQTAVISFSASDLARGAVRTKAAAKGWKDGSRCPSGASLINMARSMDCVWRWLCEEAERGVPGAMSSDSVIRWAREWRKAEGMEGDIARAILCEVAGTPPVEKPRVVTEPVVLDRWKFLDLQEKRAREKEERCRSLYDPPSNYTPDGAVGDLLEFRRRA